MSNFYTQNYTTKPQSNTTLAHRKSLVNTTNMNTVILEPTTNHHDQISISKLITKRASITQKKIITCPSSASISSLDLRSEKEQVKRMIIKQHKDLKTKRSNVLLNGSILTSTNMTALLCLLTTITLVALFSSQLTEARMNIIAPTPPNQCKY